MAGARVNTGIIIFIVGRTDNLIPSLWLSGWRMRKPGGEEDGDRDLICKQFSCSGCKDGLKADKAQLRMKQIWERPE